MTRDELIEKLKGFEWNDVEFKEAAREVPKDAWSTVSAFSNTAGGSLVFGVRYKNGVHEIVGVIEVDKVQNDFLSAIRGVQKLNRAISVTESFIKEGNATLLVFHIPEARRQDKPVYLHGEIKQTFIRRGAGDEKCRPEEIECFLREAAEERYDCETVETDVQRFFHPQSLAWYRRVYNERNPGHESALLSDVEFLHYWGLVIEQSGVLLPTRAAILLFGTGSVVRQFLPRAVVDCQWIPSNWADTLPDERWSDRILVEDNLIRAWQAMVQKFMGYSKHPFSVDPTTLRREDSPPDYLAFRESAINLLIHQDYADHNRKAWIYFYNDRIVLFNPGDSFADTDQLLVPGAKPLRNPRIVAALRRIGLNEEAGTGFRIICRSWERLGNIPPVVKNEKGTKSFTLHLVTESLLSEQQLLFQASLGVRLSDSESKAFAIACRNGELRVRDVKAVAGLTGKDAQVVLDRLLVEVLVEEVIPGNRTHVRLAQHLMERMSAISAGSPKLVSDQHLSKPANLVTDQPLLRSLSDTQRKIVRMCDVYRSIANIMDKLHMTNRTVFRRIHFEPLLKGGILQLRFPEQPKHPQQAYVVTAAGLALLDEAAKNKTNKRDDV